MSETETSVKIYFMTGTGNSYWAATQLSDLAKKSYNSVKIIPAGSKSLPAGRSVNRNNIIGFSYPTHGFSLYDMLQCLSQKMCKFFHSPDGYIYHPDL